MDIEGIHYNVSKKMYGKKYKNTKLTCLRKILVGLCYRVF